MNFVLMTIYIILIIINILLFINKKVSKIVLGITVLLLFFLMSGYKYIGNGDSIDFLAYLDGYNNFEESSQVDFLFYYLFYLSQYITISLSLDFYQWWAVMTVLMLSVILFTLRNSKFNPHQFFVYFMIFYVFIFFCWLKFYFGFVFLLFAFSFLVRGRKFDKLKFLLLVLIAGGFHAMYYVFLVFIVVDQKTQKLIKTAAILSISLSIAIILTNNNFNLLQAIIDFIGNWRISYYFSDRTNRGFLIPMGIHVLTLIYTYNYRKYLLAVNSEKSTKIYVDALLFSNILAIIFYPLFIVSLVFMRIITAFSLVSITLSGFRQELIPNNKRLFLLGIGLMIVFAYSFYYLYVEDYWIKTYVPFFDSYYFK